MIHTHLNGRTSIARVVLSWTLGLAVLVGTSTVVFGWQRQLKQTMSKAELKSACAKAGGDFTDSPKDKAYACGSKKGTQVKCEYGSGKCTGYGKGQDPTDIARKGSSLTVADVLGTAPAAKQ